MSKVFLVTGSSRGLGRRIAEKVLAAGHSLVATARRPEQLADLVERHGDRVRAVALDVTDPRAARAAVDTAVTAFGRLDVVVNNAGYANSGSVEDTPDDDFRAQVDANLFGVVNVTAAALPVLREQGSATSSRSRRSAAGWPRRACPPTRPPSSRSAASRRCSRRRSRRWASR